MGLKISYNWDQIVTGLCCNFGSQDLRFRYDSSHVGVLIPAWSRAKPLGFGLGGEAGEGFGQGEGLLLPKPKAPRHHRGPQGQKRRTVHGNLGHSTPLRPF